MEGADMAREAARETPRGQAKRRIPGGRVFLRRYPVDEPAETLDDLPRSFASGGDDAPRTMLIRPLVLGFAVLTAWAVSEAAAATLTGSVNTAPGPANLTTEGTLDWAIWNYSASTSALSIAPSNEKSGSLGLISDISAATTGGVRGGNPGTQTFTYSNGTSPVSQSNATLGLVFDTNLDAIGEGVQLTVTGDPLTLEVVNIWATGFDGVGTLTATLNGAAPITLFSQTYSNSLKPPTLFTLNFQPNLGTDLLTVRYTLSTNGAATNSHVGIQAVTVSNVPEPSTAVALIGGVGLLLAFRRRQ
jgi:hypothetical protein